MEHEIFSSLGIPATSKWLEDHLLKNGMARKTFASLVDVSAPQLTRILQSKEAVPERVMAHACRVFGLDDIETEIVSARLAAYNAYRDFDQSTDRLCTRHTRENLESLVLHIENELLEVASALYKQSSLLNEERRLRRLARFFSDADLLTRLLIRTFLGENGVLLSPENVSFHLRQPLSSYVGAIIKIRNSTKNDKILDLKNIVLKELRQLAKENYCSGNGLDYVQQHAVHMLSRYGEGQDRPFTTKYIDLDDILARRMALFGLSLGGDFTIDSQLFSLMQNDNRFLQAVASFDGVHYGDASLVEGRLPATVLRLEITISNSLAYITQDILEENLDLNFIKLTAFLKHYGPVIFTENHFVVIKQIIKVMSETPRLSAPRREFQSQFQELLKSRL